MFQEDARIDDSRKRKRSQEEANRGPLKRRADELLPIRRSLPIFAHADEIRTHLSKSNVLVLVGETGSGKSTQVPQFLVNEPWCKVQHINSKKIGPGQKPKKVGGCIAITEPRRVAAISLARRVGEEMGTPLGKSSPASQVGYSVRFDQSISPSTRIKFLTEGMLLQEMLRDPYLREYSAVIVDEVHERAVNVDLILGFLRRMLERPGEGRDGVGLKVVVMSATADMERIQNFFRIGPIINGNSGKHEMTNGHAESSSDEESEFGGFSEVEDDTSSGHNKMADFNGVTGTPEPSSCFIKGRQYPVKLVYTPQPVPDVLDAALQKIIDIHTHQPLPGDILVFLTGQETVETLESLCVEYATRILKDHSIPKLQVLPLFASLPQVAQQRVFHPTPPRTRKVIISTNIAETSLTVPGVRFVVDSGKHKIKRFRSRLNLDSLLVKTISKSSADQRKGRAGREAPGTCYRLYPEIEYLRLPTSNDPEILRCDLTQLVLTLKAHGVIDLATFPFLTSPPPAPLERALIHLLQLSALDIDTGDITVLGRSLAALPLAASLGRVLLASATLSLDCLSECIDIVSALSVENLFLATHNGSEERKEEAEAARRDLYRREGDHLTLLATVQGYVAENTDRKAWCEKRFISHRAMQSVVDVRKQLTAHMDRYQKQQSQAALSSAEEITPIDLADRILRAFLTGFGSNTALLMPDGSYKTLITNQAISIHPASVLFGRKVEAIMYNEFVWTTKGYARGVSAVQFKWIGDVLAPVP